MNVPETGSSIFVAQVSLLCAAKFNTIVPVPFPIRVIGYNCRRSKSMTTTTTPDDATATEHPKLIRTYRTRAYLSRAGHVRLDDVLAQQCLLYNAALEERRTAWKQHHQRISFAEQSRSLTAIRSDFPDIEGSLHRRIQDATLKRLDRAFAAFHRRAQAGEAPGHPRFKSSRRWKTLEMYSGNARCVFVDESTGKGLVRIKGLPVLRFKDKRVPAGIQPLQILVSRRPNGVYLYFRVRSSRGAAPCRRSEEPGRHKRRPRRSALGILRRHALSDAGVWITRAVAGYSARSRGRNWDRSRDKRLLRSWQSIPIGRRFETVTNCIA